MHNHPRARLASLAALMTMLGAMGGAAGCAEEAKEEPGSPLVSIRDGLTFVFGSSTPCFAVSAAEGNRVTCDTLGSLAAPSVKVYPTMTVTLAPFAIEATEVTNAQYAKCVDEGKCSRPAGLNDLNANTYYDAVATAEHPVIGTTWAQARSYCTWIGRRLPSEFEWERVAGGAPDYTDRGDRTIVPKAAADVATCVGTDVNVSYCNAEATAAQAVGTSADDAVTVGDGVVYDLAGNVAEWTETVWTEDVTCAAALEGCRNCFGCAGADFACMQGCNACPACDDAGDACFVQCPGRGPGNLGFPICIQHEGEVTQPTGPTTGDTHAVRGGHYLVDDSETCVLRVADRSQQIRASSLSPYSKQVGFRCAAEPPPLEDEEGVDAGPTAPPEDVVQPPAEDVTAPNPDAVRVTN